MFCNVYAEVDTCGSRMPLSRRIAQVALQTIMLKSVGVKPWQSCQILYFLHKTSLICYKNVYIVRVFQIHVEGWLASPH